MDRLVYVCRRCDRIYALEGDAADDGCLVCTGPLVQEYASDLADLIASWLLDYIPPDSITDEDLEAWEAYVRHMLKKFGIDVTHTSSGVYRREIDHANIATIDFRKVNGPETGAEPGSTVE